MAAQLKPKERDNNRALVQSIQPEILGAAAGFK
jgi:hypothetical protein